MMWNNYRILLRPVFWQMMLGIAISAVAALSSLGLTVTAVWLIISAAYQPALYQLSLAILGVRVCGITRAIFRYAERYVTHNATFLFLRGLRVFAYRRMAEMPFSSGGKTNGEMAALIVREIETLKDIYLRAMLPLSSAFLSILAAFCLLFLYAPLAAALLPVSFIFASAVIPFFISRQNKKNTVRLHENSQKMQNLYLDLLYGAAGLLAANRLPDKLLEAENLAKKAETERIRDFRLRALSGSLTEAIGSISILAGILLLLPLVNAHVLSGIHFVVAIFILQSVIEVLMPLPLIWHYYDMGIAAARKVFSLPDGEIKEGLKHMAHPELPTDKAPLLEAENLSFTYHGEAVMRDVSFCIAEGDRVAIVGPSGAGKSTLFAMLLALYEQEKGELRLKGISYRELSPEVIRNSFSAVMQESHFFQRTIAENLRLLCPGATDEQMWTVLEKAGLFTFVEGLPEGLQTDIGQHGRKLSGGQRQRLALAAAFLQQNPILLLDEPTRGLDVHTARKVRRMLFSLSGIQTLIYITHELADLVYMDKIIVMCDGSVAEVGSYGDLMKNRGVFYRMKRLYDGCGN